MTLDTEETGRVADLGAELIGLVGEVPQRRSWPSVSAIVPTHNGRRQLQMLLRGLSGQTDYPDLEVIVVDNASSDGTLEWVQAQAFPFALIVIRNPRNFSFSAAVNVGATRARGELLLFLNDDVEPIERGWLAATGDDLRATGDGDLGSGAGRSREAIAHGATGGRAARRDSVCARRRSATTAAAGTRQRPVGRDRTRPRGSGRGGGVCDGPQARVRSRGRL